MRPLHSNTAQSLALSAWQKCLGEGSVVFDEANLKAIETITFRTDISVLAILKPQNVEDILNILTIARQHRIPLYPVSRGRNWGLGSRLPTAENCAVLDLSQLNRILDYDEQLSYLTVEPGVTFEQATAFLKEKGSQLFLSVIGGPPDASIVGNCVERGEGVGPYGERMSTICSYQAVLGNGRILETGFLDQSRARNLSRWAPGPSLDGIFSQSNFGIITRLTIWLHAKPREFQSFCFTVPKNNSGKETELIERLRNLHQQGVIKPCSLALWNSQKFLASQQQYPWQHFKGIPTSSQTELLNVLEPHWRGTRWFGFGALYSASSTHARADSKLFRKALGKSVSRLVLLNKRKAQIATRLARPLGRLLGLNVRQTLDSLFHRSIYLGNPITTSLQSVYWRKRKPLPAELNPDRDLCGVLWLCHVVPFSAEHLKNTEDIVEGICADYCFEPNIAFLNMSERHFHAFVMILFDRESPEEDESALRCHDQIFAALEAAGYSAYRLGHRSMSLASNRQESEIEILRQIKNVCDPDQIIAPGRYDRAIF